MASDCHAIRNLPQPYGKCRGGAWETHRVTKPRTTTESTGVAPWRLLLRGAFHRCPICGGGKVIRRWFWMADHCPTCDLRYERLDGQMIGYIGLNTIVTFGATFVVLLVGSVLMAPDIRTTPLLVACSITAVAFPILLMPSCRLGWCAVDLLLRPLQPNEVDPRFVRE
jgi:uncharacterized protein (DUF983 family)